MIDAANTFWIGILAGFILGFVVSMLLDCWISYYWEKDKP